MRPILKFLTFLNLSKIIMREGRERDKKAKRKERNEVKAWLWVFDPLSDMKTHFPVWPNCSRISSTVIEWEKSPKNITITSITLCHTLCHCCWFTRTTLLPTDYNIIKRSDAIVFYVREGKNERKEGSKKGREEGRKGVCMHVGVRYCKTKHATIGLLGLSTYNLLWFSFQVSISSSWVFCRF